MSSFEVPIDQRQLFLDDAGIAEVRNLTRTFHQPQKRGAVVRSSTPQQTIQTVSTPVWDPDEKLFKFWVIGTDDSYRTNPDGLHWTAGPKQTNGVSMAVRDPHDSDPEYRYKAAMGNHGFAASPMGSTGPSSMCQRFQVLMSTTSPTIRKRGCLFIRSSVTDHMDGQWL